MSGLGLNRSSIGLPYTGACMALVVLVAGSALAAPPNDHLADAVVLTGETNFVTGFNAGATSEPSETNHAHAAASKSVWWTWQAPFTGSVTVSTLGSSFDTVLSVYTGNSFSNLQTVAENDDAGGFGVVVSALVFRAFAGETFRIAVDGFNGATGTVRLAVGRITRPAPNWSLLDLDGRTVRSSDFRYKVYAIDFWETTCGACVDELPALKQLQGDLSPQGFSFFGVSKDVVVKPGAIKSWVEAHGIPYDIAMNNASFESLFGGEVPLPSKIVIDREGNLIGIYSGGGDYTFYEEKLRPLLRGSTQVPLTVERQNTALAFAWPATEFGYDLESSPVPGGTNWTVVPFPVATTNDQNNVTVPVGASDQFFRLRKTVSN